MKNEELRIIKPFLSLRRQIEFYEDIIAPELKYSKDVHKDMKERMSFHEMKWRKMLQKNTDPFVQEILKLINKEWLQIKVFCQRIGSLFTISSKKIHIPEVASYKWKELKQIIRNHFEDVDKFTLKSIKVITQLCSSSKGKNGKATTKEVNA